MTTTDQFSDPAYATLVKEAALRPRFAEFVKGAELDPAEKTRLPDSAFAWPDERRFPIHSAKQAALSYAYALSQEPPTPVLDRLREALDVYGVPLSVFEATETKTAAATQDRFLLPDLQLLPVQSAADVKTAELRLLSELPKLSLPHRAMACENLVKKAREYGVGLHPAVLQLAGLVVSSTKIASEWLDARAGACRNDILRTAYQKLATELRHQGPELSDRDALTKVAAVVGELDERAGLVRHYDRRLPDPLRTIFNTEKVAATSIDLGGTLVPLAKLAALPASFWEDLGGPELAREIAPNGRVDAEKLAAVIPTLPLDLKVILRSQVGGRR